MQLNFRRTQLHGPLGPSPGRMKIGVLDKIGKMKVDPQRIRGRLSDGAF